MNQLVTKGIVLARTNFGEADRILTLLTPDQGKLRLMAKGARRVKSKLAGGIELFSVSDITFIRGRGDIGTLVSARLQRHYGHIIEDIGRTMLGYELIKRINKATEDEPEPAYFELLQSCFVALDDPGVEMELIEVWFIMQLLRLAGHAPNLYTDVTGKKLKPEQRYDFDFERMAFAPGPRGKFGTDQIKFLRLCLTGTMPGVLQKVQRCAELVAATSPLVNAMAAGHLLRST